MSSETKGFLVFYSIIITFIALTLGILMGIGFTFEDAEPEPSYTLIESKPIEVREVEPEPVKVKPMDTEITEDFYIFQPCGFTTEDLSNALSSESHKAMLPYVDTLLEAEAEYGVNAFYLLCKFGLESGWGRYMAGENNIGGWMNDNGGFRDFDSVEECIMHIARNLSDSYREKVGGRLGDVCERYCPDEGYTRTLIQIMNERQDKIMASL